MDEHNCSERLFPINEGIYECVDCNKKYTKRTGVSKFTLKILYLLATLCGIFVISSLFLFRYLPNGLTFFTVLFGLYGFVIFFELIVRNKQGKIHSYIEIDGE